MKKGFLTVLLSVLAGGLTAYAVVRASEPKSASVVRDSEGNAVEYRTVNLAESDYPDFTYAAESAVEAVVYVEVTVQSRSQYQNIDPFFRFFFGDEYGSPRSREQKGSGSGVIIRQDGYIVTNNHVVQDASKISVTLNNNEQYEATVVGTDAATDVAIIKIDADGLPTIPLGDSDQLRLGEWVLAIGSPLGDQLCYRMSSGILCCKVL
jgi:S1-C subfamily serine protease